MKSIFILIISCSTFLSINLDKTILEDFNKCSAELSVEKNRNVKSVSNEGANFNLILKNTSTNTTTYYLNAINLVEPCGNKKMKSTGINVMLNSSFKLEGSLLPDNKIILNSGQSKTFAVHVSIPEGTPYYNWGCIEIEVYSEECGSRIANTTLSVYVPNPSDD